MRAMQNRKRDLLWHGALLFLLGLLTGFVQQQFRNPRMGLAAHLEGLMNGTFLIAVGAAWSELRLSARQIAWVYGTLLYGAYANWAFTALAAIFGTTAMTPLTGAGHGGAQWQETLVAAGFTSVALAIVTATVLLLVGFRRSPTAA
jgi:(hydroxyamino)benzene mutase